MSRMLSVTVALLGAAFGGCQRGRCCPPPCPPACAAPTAAPSVAGPVLLRADDPRVAARAEDGKPLPPTPGFRRIRLNNTTNANRTVTVVLKRADDTTLGTYTVTAVTLRYGLTLTSVTTNVQKIDATIGGVTQTWGPLSGTVYWELDLTVSDNAGTLEIHGEAAFGTAGDALQLEGK